MTKPWTLSPRVPIRYNQVNIPQRSNSTRFQQKRRPLRQRLPNPAHRKRPQDMAMRHDQHVRRRTFLRRRTHDFSMEAFSNIVDQPIEPIRDIFRRPAAIIINTGHAQGTPPSQAPRPPRTAPRSIWKKKNTYSPPGHPSLQISQPPFPSSFLNSLIRALVKPSYSP